MLIIKKEGQRKKVKENDTRNKIGSFNLKVEIGLPPIISSEILVPNLDNSSFFFSYSSIVSTL